MFSFPKTCKEFFFSKISKNLSPYFRFTYQVTLIFAFAGILGCDREEDPADTLDDPKPVPADSRTVNVIIDGPYDFKNALAHSLIDSLSLSDSKEILYAPSGTQSPIILTDKFTGEVLALVHLDSIQSEVKINAETVTRAFLQLIPAFNSLSNEAKGRFLNDAKGIKVYNDVLVSIDGFLKTKESIYSSKPEFIAQSILLNDYIFENYLNIQDVPGGRQAQDLESFSKWITPENGASIVNQVRSYVYIEFVPIGQGEKITSVLEPRNFYLAPTPVPVSDLKVPDNCYTVYLSQSNSQAKSKNVFEIAKRSTEIMFGALFGSFGNSRNDCIAKIAGSLISSVNGIILGTVNSQDRELDLIKGSIKAVGDVIYTNASDLSCAKYLTSKSVWYKFIAKNAIFISRIIDGVGLLKDGTEMVPYVIAVLDGEEMSQVMQLYNGKLIQACVGGTNASTFNEIYSSGSKIYPIVKMVPKSEYGPWSKAGFKVEWKTSIPNGGSVNLPSSSSDQNGEATVEWTLPTNFSGEVQLIAEIKDKETDHLFGSPITFKTQVTQIDSIEIYKAAVLGKWKTETYGIPSMELGYTSFENVLPNGLVHRTSYLYPDGTVQSANSYYPWSITGNNTSGFYWTFSDVKSRRLTYPLTSMITELSWVRNYHTR